MLSKKKISGPDVVASILDNQGYIIMDRYNELEDREPEDVQDPEELEKIFAWY